MKKFIIIFCLTTGICLITIPNFKIINKQPVFAINKSIPKSIKKIKRNTWDKLIHAFIMVESRGNNIIQGEGNAVGCLQITPVYVKAVNRILREKGSKIQYTLDDRKSRKKSIEMFNIMQSKYNPHKNIAKAIKLHNPGSSQKYHDKIVRNMK